MRSCDQTEGVWVLAAAAAALLALGAAGGCKDVNGPSAAAPQQAAPAERHVESGTTENAAQDASARKTQRSAGGAAVNLEDLWPPVRLDPPGLFDLGDVILDVPVETTFELVNHGEVDIVLRDSQSNCGCTTADVAGLVIPAGGSIEVPLYFDAEGRLGERSATVDLFFEGWERPIRFRITAYVVEG